MLILLVSGSLAFTLIYQSGGGRITVVLFQFCPLQENPDLINSAEFCELLLVFNSSFAHALDIRTEFMLPAHAFICFAVWIGVRVCPQIYSRPTFLLFCSVSGFLTSSAPPLEYHSRDCVFMVWVIFFLFFFFIDWVVICCTGMGVFLLSPPLSKEKSDVLQCCKISDLCIVILQDVFFFFSCGFKIRSYLAVMNDIHNTLQQTSCSPWTKQSLEKTLRKRTTWPASAQLSLQELIYKRPFGLHLLARLPNPRGLRLKAAVVWQQIKRVPNITLSITLFMLVPFCHVHQSE